MNPLPLAILAGALFLLHHHRGQGKPRRPNLDGYLDSYGFHPIRGSEGYDPEMVGERLRASPNLRTFLTDVDKDIARAKRQKDGSKLEELQDLRLNSILISLPPRRQKEYEEAQEQIYQLEIMKEPRTRPELDPVYRFRELANIAKKYGEDDIRHPKFRAEVKKRYGVSLDEIGEKLFPGLSNNEELAVERAIELQRGRKRHQSVAAVDDQISHLQRFVKSVETGLIMGIGQKPSARKPKGQKPRSVKAAKDEGLITNIAEARRFGRRARAS